jgi:putative transposase
MGRPLRPVADALLYHALNRGNNRHRVFFSAADYRAFLRALAQTQLRYPFRLYGYCLMSNHFHLLLEPEAGQSISRILQSLTVAHTWRHTSSGHVWQGRFKSAVVQSDNHALTVLRYIEANPLRAKMVRDLADYAWSSYPAHSLGQTNALLSELPCWPGLAKSEPERQSFWRGWVHQPLTERELAAVRHSVVSGVPYGAAGWVESKLSALGLRKPARPRGRPRKQAAEEKMN